MYYALSDIDLFHVQLLCDRLIGLWKCICMLACMYVCMYVCMNDVCMYNVKLQQYKQSCHGGIWDV